MAVYLDENEESKRRSELEQYDREIQAGIDESNVNARARRKQQDKLFQKGLITMFVIVFIVLAIMWAR
ncbi:MAG: hypothetical protein K6G81_02080 [Lachnospiraceae bacterium]|nr:hypothetical protein [Lachnospiraceae bacterium]